MKTMTSYILVVTAVLSMFGIYHFKFSVKTPQIATVNINQLVDEKIRQLAAGGKSEAENKEAIGQFGKKMEQEIKLMAKENHLILLPSAAVLSGAEDVTDTLRKRLAVP